MASRWFMRGTDPIKSTWEYPNLIFVKGDRPYNRCIELFYIALYSIEFI